MRWARKTLTITLLACLASVPPVPALGGPRQDAAAAADALLRELAPGAVGLSVAVVADGRVVWTGAYGPADRERGVPVTSDTRMRIYSISKPMTAVAIARLLERGRLDPEASIQSWVPAFPDKGAKITPMQLATHTAGIRHYADDAEARSSRHCDSVEEALPIFASDPLVHAPGEGQTYSSWGYVLLSAVLEGAAGVPYERAMRELVFEPAGLDSLAIDDPTVEVPRRAAFYQEAGPGEFMPAEPVDNTCKWGAGAWLATAEDVARFGGAMFDGTLLAARTQQMFLRGESTYEANGWSAGAMAFLRVDAERGVAVALLSNAIGEHVGPDLQGAVARIHELFLENRTEESAPAAEGR